MQGAFAIYLKCKVLSTIATSRQSFDRQAALSSWCGLWLCLQVVVLFCGVVQFFSASVLLDSSLVLL